MNISREIGTCVCNVCVCVCIGLLATCICICQSTVLKPTDREGADFEERMCAGGRGGGGVLGNYW